MNNGILFEEKLASGYVLVRILWYVIKYILSKSLGDNQACSNIRVFEEIQRKLYVGVCFGNNKS